MRKWYVYRWDAVWEAWRVDDNDAVFVGACGGGEKAFTPGARVLLKDFMTWSLPTPATRLYCTLLGVRP